MELEQAIRTPAHPQVFAPQPVAPEGLKELLKLTKWAPNHHLTDPWRFRVLGPRTLARLKELAEELAPGSAASCRAATLIVASVMREG